MKSNNHSLKWLRPSRQSFFDLLEVLGRLRLEELFVGCVVVGAIPLFFFVLRLSYQWSALTGREYAVPFADLLAQLCR